MKLSDFKVLTFDVYGTLIDWESGMIAGLKPLTDQVSPALTRDQILEAHAFYESTTQAQVPTMVYSDVLAIVYKRLGEEWGIKTSFEDCAAYGASVQHWPAFDDSPDALAYLRDHFTLVVLSNVDNRSFSHSSTRLGDPFHVVYTAQDAGSYKPAQRNFDYMLNGLARLGYAPSDILHTAESMFHDHGPANKAGLASCWIYRRHAQDGFGATMNPGTMPRYDLMYHSMADLVAAHKAELAG